LGAWQRLRNLRWRWPAGTHHAACESELASDSLRPGDRPSGSGQFDYGRIVLQAVKWRNFKVHFYQQETMVSPPIKLAIPLLFNLYKNQREEQDKQITDSWIFGPVLKMVGEFEASTKKYPLIAMGTPDPYTPPH
jgi:hypothetical protein